VADEADFVGSTSAMMKFVRSSDAPYFLMLTGCRGNLPMPQKKPEPACVLSTRARPRQHIARLRNTPCVVADVSTIVPLWVNMC